MTGFKDRETAEEAKFAHDQQNEFIAVARRNKMLGAWAAEQLGLAEDQTGDYIAALVRADLAEAGDADLVRKVLADFTAHGLSLSETELRARMNEWLAKARADARPGQ